jgi:hypothetical protein
VTGDRCEGRDAIRNFFGGSIATFEEYESESEEVSDLGNGVRSAIVLANARYAGKQARYGCGAGISTRPTGSESSEPQAPTRRAVSCPSHHRIDTVHRGHHTQNS